MCCLQSGKVLKMGKGDSENQDETESCTALRQLGGTSHTPFIVTAEVSV